VDTLSLTQIDAFEWLGFSKEQLPDAVHLGGMTARQFLLHGKMYALKELLQRLPKVSGDDVTRIQESTVRELRGYAKLCEYFLLFWEWESLSTMKHAQRDRIPVNIKIKDVTGRLEKTADLLLTSGWAQLDEDIDLMEDEQERTRQEETRKLREFYIPNVLFVLLEVLYQTRESIPRNLEKSIEVAHLVASEEHCLYREVMASRHMPRLLHLLRRSVLATLPTGS